MRGTKVESRLVWAGKGCLRKDPVGHWTPPQVCMKMEQRADGSKHGRCDSLGCQNFSSPMRTLQIPELPQHCAYRIRAMGLQNVMSRPSTNLPSRRCPVRGAGKSTYSVATCAQIGGVRSIGTVRELPGVRLTEIHVKYKTPLPAYT